MKHQVLSLIALITISSPSAFAFLTNQEQQFFITSLNKMNTNENIKFEEVHCSRRNRLCIVKAEINKHQTACVVDRLMDSSDLLDSKTNKVAPYAESTISSCVQKLL